MKMCYFTFNFGSALIFPFIPLQMADLGLTIEDIGYIYGLYPLITMFSGPIAGSMIGVVGRNGHKVVWIPHWYFLVIQPDLLFSQSCTYSVAMPVLEQVLVFVFHKFQLYGWHPINWTKPILYTHECLVNVHNLLWTYLAIPVVHQAMGMRFTRMWYHLHHIVIFIPKDSLVTSSATEWSWSSTSWSAVQRPRPSISSRGAASRSWSLTPSSTVPHEIRVVIQSTRIFFKEYHPQIQELNYQE